MHSRPLLLSYFLPLLALFFQPATSGNALRLDLLYTPQSGFLQIAPMRQLTLNAHITAFQYEPLGLEVAFVGSETQGDTTTHFVKTIDVRSGHEMSRLILTAPDGNQEPDFSLIGWSESGKYLLLKRTAGVDSNSGEVLTDCWRWDVSNHPSLLNPITPNIPPLQIAGPSEQPEYCSYSPDRRWLLFKQHYIQPSTDKKPGMPATAYFLYDTNQDTFRLLALPQDADVERWTDQSHLGFIQKSIQSLFNIVTGQVSPLSDTDDTDTSYLSKSYPELTLNAEARTLEDKGTNGGQIASHILWIRRTPLGKKPLGVAAAGLTPGDEDPQAVWSPTGKQIAFIAHGDLCVTDIQGLPATMPHPLETLALGLPLTEEEKQQLAKIAASNLKQIGLGLIQYVQDNDENYPPAEGIDDSLYPYLKTRDVFSLAGAHWVYHAPANPSLAAMDAPADTVIGTMDLGDTQITLFGDGHVKAIPKGTMP